jgi:hypothetical protein
VISYRETAIAAFAARINAVREPYSKSVNDAPFVVMEDQDERVERVDYQEYRATVNIRVESYGLPATDEDTEITEIRSVAINRLLAALIETALGTDWTLNGACDDLIYTAGGPILFDAPVDQVACFADFQLIYRYPAGQPIPPEPDPDP